MNTIKDATSIFLKGFALGTANVIPGVSGGTIALITGIFERLISSLKSLNLHALNLLLNRQFKQLATYIDFRFLALVLAGVAASIRARNARRARVQWRLVRHGSRTLPFPFHPRPATPGGGYSAGNRSGAPGAGGTAPPALPARSWMHRAHG